MSTPAPTAAEPPAPAPSAPPVQPASRTTTRRVGVLLAVLLAVQAVPSIVEEKGQFLPDFRASYSAWGRPVPFLVHYELDPAGYGGSRSLVPAGRYALPIGLATDILFATGVLAGIWFLARRVRRGWWWKAGVPFVVVLVAGHVSHLVISRAALCHPRQLEYLRAAETELQRRTADSGWIASHIATALKDLPPDVRGDGQVRPDLILFQNGDWLAYFQMTNKLDPTLADFFLGKGSDSKWYFTKAHYCIDMLEAHMDAPYASLNAFVNQPTMVQVGFAYYTYDRPPDPAMLLALPRSRPQPGAAPP